MKTGAAFLNRLRYALLVLVVTGCGDDRAHVTGKVARADGSPLSKARVIARSDSGKSASDVTDQEGRFRLSASEPDGGMEPGTYAVIIVEDRGRTDNMRAASISAKYADPAQSGLNFSVAAGEEKTFDITLDPL